MASQLKRASADVLDIHGYQEAISATLYPILLETKHSAASFAAKLAAREVGPCQVVKAFANDPFRCIRRPAQDRSANEYFLVQVQESGTTAYSHHGRNAFCATGSLVIMDCRHEIVGEQHASARCSILRVPAAKMKSVIPEVEDICSLPFATDEGAGNMFVHMMHDAWNWSSRFSAAEHQVIPDTLIQLLKAAVSSSIDEKFTSPQSYRSRQFSRLCNLVQDLAPDPDVQVDHIANAMKVSRSTLFEISRSAGTSIERLLLETRLNLAKACLSRPAARRLSISEVAYACGFSDPAHFSRKFSERFGVPPSRFEHGSPGRVN